MGVQNIRVAVRQSLSQRSKSQPFCRNLPDRERVFIVARRSRVSGQIKDLKRSAGALQSLRMPKDRLVDPA